jgi:hypothetical protein
MITFAIVMQGFPFPGLAATVVVLGLLWSICAAVINIGALHAAIRQQLLKLWFLSAVLNAILFVVFFEMAAMY